MCTCFHNMTLVHNNDLIGIPDRGKTVCDNQTGTVLHQFTNRILDVFLCPGINTGCSFVENQMLR